MLRNLEPANEAKNSTPQPVGSLRALEVDELQHIDGGWVQLVAAAAFGAAYAYGVYDTFN